MFGHNGYYFFQDIVNISFEWFKPTHMTK